MSTIEIYPWHRRFPWAWVTRVVCAWMVLIGRWSLRRAWHEGYDQHIRDDKFRQALNPTGPMYEPRGQDKSGE